MYLLVGFFLMAVGNSLPMGGFQYLVTSLLSLGFFWMMYRFVDLRSDIRLAGISPSKTWWLEFLYGSLIAGAAMAIIFGIQYYNETIRFLGFSWNQPGTSDWVFPLFIFFIQMVNVGFYEELMSRSYLLPNFKEGFTTGRIDTKTATVLAVIFSSSIFGIAHGLNPNVTVLAILNIVLAGVMLAVPYIITGRLAYSVGIHFAWNFFQGGVFGFRVSGLPIRGSIIQIQQVGDGIWTGAAFGPEGGLIGTMGILLVLVATILCIKWTGVSMKLHPNFSNTYLETSQLIQEKR